MSAELAEGDLVQFLDNKGRRYQGVLTAGQGVPLPLRLHRPRRPDRPARGLARCDSSRRQAFMVLRPTLSEFVLKMPRGAQVIYPKDLGPILMLADIGPGCRVLESGVGSGALSMAMLRAGARHHRATRSARTSPTGRCPTWSVPRRGGPGALHVELRDCYEGIDARRRRPGGARPARALAGGAPRGDGPAARWHPPAPTRRASSRSSQLREALEPRTGSSPRRRSRCSTGAGTSRARPSGPTTAWWPTPASSPMLGGGPDASAGGVNVFDLLILLAAVLAVAGGWRLGLVTRALGWIGAIAGHRHRHRRRPCAEPAGSIRPRTPVSCC